MWSGGNVSVLTDNWSGSGGTKLVVLNSKVKRILIFLFHMFALPCYFIVYRRKYISINCSTYSSCMLNLLFICVLNVFTLFIYLCFRICYLFVSYFLFIRVFVLFICAFVFIYSCFRISYLLVLSYFLFCRVCIYNNVIIGAQYHLQHT